MAKNIGSIRRAQLISTYGVGSMIPVGDESFMVAGLDRWTVGDTNVHEPRLETLLEVDGFVRPPATGKDGRNDVPVVRFPDMHYCPNCRRLERHRFFCRNSENKCSVCGVALIPSRFVVVCPNGHIDDFPYFKWVHAGKPAKEGTGKHVLGITSTGASASLADIVISCSCGEERSMDGAFGRDAMRGVTRCSGKRPWLGSEAGESCDELPRTLQRGASNNYFSVVSSSISIPPWSEGAQKLINPRWTTLRHVPSDALPATIHGMRLAEGSPFGVEDLVRAVEMRKAGDEARPKTVRDLRRQEHEALRIGKEEITSSQDFVCEPVKGAAGVVGEWLDSVMAVKRLREVRALRAFTRLLPANPADEGSRYAALALDETDWLPAIEVLGEGIFIELNHQRLTDWEAGNPVVSARADQVNQNYKRRFAERGTVPDRQITARLLLVHTLAHAMITQWSLDAGYPAASLRERLYVSDDDNSMAGFLVYTATTDSAGSLGGIIARANPTDLKADLTEAVRRMSWCSADPLCVEADASGVDALNLAACHACALLPETSCEESNILLDRAMLVGTPSDSGSGFFASLVLE